MPLLSDFVNDRQGRRFSDVMNDTRIQFADILQFLDNPDRKRRMIESEQHHDRPPLAGVIRELEHREDVSNFFSQNDGHSTMRFRQAVGVAVRIVMENQEWQTTGRKGSLGVRAPVRPQTTSPSAYHNSGGLALWFTRAERYEHPNAQPFRSVHERAAVINQTLTAQQAVR